MLRERSEKCDRMYWGRLKLTWSQNSPPGENLSDKRDTKIQRPGEKGKTVPSRWKSPERGRNLVAARNREARLHQRAGKGACERRWEGHGQAPILCSAALGNPDRSNPEQCDVTSASKQGALWKMRQ